MRVLVANAGSSSVKLVLLDGQRTLATRELSLGQSPAERTVLGRVVKEQLDRLLEGGPRPEAIGHRIVHGGERFTEAVLIDRRTRRDLEALIELAPLHQGPGLALVDALGEAFPDLPSVACFDTAFHRTLGEAAASFALPRSWRERYGIRRFGFHGLSHAWVSRRLGRALRAGGNGQARIISAHLGAGASLCAIANGRSIDTTMGFTPLDGLVMATRPGSVDPGAITWILRALADQIGADAALETVQTALEHASGLQALAGCAEMQTVLDRASNGEAQAQLARDVYIHRLAGGIAQMAASLAGVEAIAFTGGVGEHAPEIRERALRPLAFIGAALDSRANAQAAPADLCEIGAPDSPVRVFVIHAREDLEIARQVRSLIGKGQPAADHQRSRPDTPLP